MARSRYDNLFTSLSGSGVGGPGERRADWGEGLLAKGKRWQEKMKGGNYVVVEGGRRARESDRRGRRRVVEGGGECIVEDKASGLVEKKGRRKWLGRRECRERGRGIEKEETE